MQACHVTAEEQRTRLQARALRQPAPSREVAPRKESEADKLARLENQVNRQTALRKKETGAEYLARL